LIATIVDTPEKSGKNGGIANPPSAAIPELLIQIVVVSSTLFLRTWMFPPFPFPPEGPIAGPPAVLLALLHVVFLQAVNAPDPVDPALLHLLWNPESSKILNPVAPFHVSDDNADTECSVRDLSHPWLMTTVYLITPTMM
jgi:hypothetical protein